MHAVLDGLLDSLQQAQQAEHAVRQQAALAHAAAGAASAGSSEGKQGDERQAGGVGSAAGHPAGGDGGWEGTETAAGSCSSEGGSCAEEQGEQAWQQQPEQQQAEDATGCGSPGAHKAFAFLAFATQQPQQHEAWGSVQEASASTGSAGALRSFGAHCGAGFGSPFKPASQHPSPAKAPAAGRAGGLLAAGSIAAAQLGHQGPERLVGTNRKSLSFAPLPTAPAGAGADERTPVLLRPGGGGLDPYRTARSVASAASSSLGGSGSRMASSGGGSAGRAAATPGYFSSRSSGSGGSTLAPVLGGVGAGVGAAGGKDMDQILGSIRHLAAEMR